MIGRRELFTGAAAAGALATGPTLAVHSSHLRSLYYRWQAAKQAYNALPDAEDEAAFRRMTDIEKAVADHEPQSIEDLAIKVIVADDDGDMSGSAHQEALVRQAHTIAGL